ncbi:unnamed protein product [Diamesa tonsa]
MMTVVLCLGHRGHKYEMELMRVVLMNKSEFITIEKFGVHRYNKTVYAVSGGLNFNIDFGVGWEVAMDCWRSKLGNNQWELTVFKAQRQSVCDFVKNVYKTQIQSEFEESSNLPVFKDGDATCPFPKGKYRLTNHMADVRNFPISLQDGIYRIELFMFHQNRVRTGFIIYLRIYPEIG